MDECSLAEAAGVALQQAMDWPNSLVQMSILSFEFWQKSTLIGCSQNTVLCHIVTAWEALATDAASQTLRPVPRGLSTMWLSVFRHLGADKCCDMLLHGFWPWRHVLSMRNSSPQCKVASSAVFEAIESLSHHMR